MPPVSWLKGAIGLGLGAAAAFALGCAGEYYLWNPPSNDWGNDKTITTVLLTAAAIPVLVAAVFARRPLFRLFRQMPRIGRPGMIGAAAGAILLPAAQLACVFGPWRAHAAALDRERSAMAAGLDAIGRQLSGADSVVVYLPPLLSSAGAEGTFFRRLSRFTGKPVYRLGTAGGNRWVVTRYRDAPGAGREEVFDAEDPPATGVLLSFIPDTATMIALAREEDDHRMRDYYSIAIAPLDPRPDKPGGPPYRFDDLPTPIWQNCGFVQPAGIGPDGPTPFGRLLRWEQCAMLLDADGLVDRLFAGPAGNRAGAG
ncbi:MAG TPA: hypothetical protein VKS60_20050 [Stellaceae bacterium]|nr:hypothetical protein [Stellaceae bacterium]